MKQGDEITLRILEVDGPVVLCENVRDREHVAVLLPKDKTQTYPIREWRSMEKKIKTRKRDRWV